MKRRIYFEGDDQKLVDDRWVLPATAHLLPYWYLDDFTQAVSGEWSEDQLRRRLLSGISHSEGVPYDASGRLSLTLSKNHQEELTVIKQFEASQFRCSSGQNNGPYIEGVPDTLELTHIEGTPEPWIRPEPRRPAARPQHRVARISDEGSSPKDWCVTDPEEFQAGIVANLDSDDARFRRRSFPETGPLIVVEGSLSVNE
jgi:hypothetical protein